MKIDSYEVNMQASNSFVQSHESKISVSTFTQTLSENRTANENSIDVGKSSTKAVFNNENELSVEDRVKKRVIEQLIEQMMKKNSKVKLFPNEYQKMLEKENNNPYTNSGVRGSSWGFVYESSEEYYQKSSVEFSAQATIMTSKGEFNIDLNISYSQEFYEMHKTRISFGETNFEDPLLINMQDSVSSFDSISKNMNFMFDINSDGKKEEIALLKDGVGFLALDKNKNGEIDNGHELFGATSGDGFGELKAYDEDGNNWIDENDSIFKNLRVWEINEKGENSLVTLGQVGIGAIYLSTVGTSFNYSEAIGEENAKMKESSIFLKENGESGVISSVDFRV